MVPSRSSALARVLARMGPVKLAALLATLGAFLAIALGTYISYHVASAGAGDSPASAGPAGVVQSQPGSSRGLAQAFRLDVPTPPPPAAAEEATQEQLPPADFIWPTDGPLSQGMTPLHPNGVDLSVNAGTPVHAVRDGEIAFAGGLSCCEYGFFIIIEHDEGWSTLYAHLDAFAVKQGDKVRQGQLIGLSGNTGKSSGPHLHFELRWFGKPVDPTKMLKPARKPPPADLAAAVLWSPPRTEARPPLASSPPLPSAPLSDQPASGPDAPPPSAAPPGEPSAPSSPVSSELTRDRVIALAAEWLSRQPEAVYDIDASSCFASRNGPNWTVTCRGVPAGCSGAEACYIPLTACVFEQPFLISRSCP